MSDPYLSTVILFNSTVINAVTHNFMSTPNELLNIVLQHYPGQGTRFKLGLQGARAAMENHWSAERAPVVIFLSDGEGRVNEEQMRGLCRSSMDLGKPLSFYAVSFGPFTEALQQMARIAQDIERTAPADQLNRAGRVPSSFTEALDTVQLAETFLGIATSLESPVGPSFADER